MIGLLLKKSDKLFIDVNQNFTLDKMALFPNTLPSEVNTWNVIHPVTNDTKFYETMQARGWFNVYGNQTTHKFNVNSTSRRIGLLFDFNNDVMALFRRIAQDMYWVMIAIIMSQIILL